MNFGVRKHLHLQLIQYKFIGKISQLQHIALFCCKFAVKNTKHGRTKKNSSKNEHDRSGTRESTTVASEKR